MDSIPSIIGVQILAGLQQKNVHRENTMQKIDGKMVTEIIFSSAIKVKIFFFSTRRTLSFNCSVMW